LLGAGSSERRLIGRLFSVLDGAGVPGAQGTILTKIVHRKRPAFIPLYDEHVRRVYQDGEGAPVPWVKGRSWADFMTLFAAAVQVDLEREHEFWEEIASFAPGPSISALRALDIVAWRTGAQMTSEPVPEVEPG
jgi:hypothetical protein